MFMEFPGKRLLFCLCSWCAVAVYEGSVHWGWVVGGPMGQISDSHLLKSKG